MNKEKSGLWEVASLALLWCIWMEWTSRISRQQSQPVLILWDKIILFLLFVVKAQFLSRDKFSKYAKGLGIYFTFLIGIL